MQTMGHIMRTEQNHFIGTTLSNVYVLTLDICIRIPGQYQSVDIPSKATARGHSRDCISNQSVAVAVLPGPMETALGKGICHVQYKQGPGQ